MKKETIIAGLLLVCGITGAVLIKDKTEKKVAIAKAEKEKQRDLELKIVNDAFAKLERVKDSLLVKKAEEMDCPVGYLENPDGYVIIENRFEGTKDYVKINKNKTYQRRDYSNYDWGKAPQESMTELKVKQLMNSVHDPNTAYNRYAR